MRTGALVALFAFVALVALPELVPDDVRRWGMLSFGALAAGFGLLAAQRAIAKR